MSFEEFTRSAPGLLTAIASVIVALTSFATARRKWRADEKRERKSPDAQRHSSAAPIIAVALGGVLLGLTVAIIATRYSSHGPIVTTTDTTSTKPPVHPTIAITEPADRGSVVVTVDPNGSGRFLVHGTSTAVASDPSLRIFVLVHPENPFGEGFWIQREPAVDQNGTWSGLGWIGTRGFEAKKGDTLWITAVIAKRQNEPRGPDGQAWVENPNQLSPLATTPTTHVTVAQANR